MIGSLENPWFFCHGQGDALDPTTYTGVLSGAKLVVSTIGTLLESDWYKKFIR